MASRRSNSRTSATNPSVSEFISTLDHPHKAGIESLRKAILAADSRITEEIKWNAPSFKLHDHFLTFKLFPPKNIQLVFHVGSKPRLPARTFKLDFPELAIKWPASDRCVLTLTDTAQAEELAPLVAQAVRQWLVQLSS